MMEQLANFFSSNAPYLIAFGVGTLLVLLTLPLFAVLGKRVGLVDKPDKTRKLHENAIPLVGGVVVAFATLVSCLIVFNFFDIRLGKTGFAEAMAILGGSFVILLVGVLDDRFNLRGRQKLMGQILAASVLVFSGFQFSQVAFASIVIKFGIFSVLVAYIWILLAINSVNLLDGADGFASTIGIVIFLAMSVMSIYMGNPLESVLCMAFAGALLGFLRFNFPPAKVFLGDAGSMFIGFILAAVTIRCSFKQATAYAFFAPVALLAIPLIDTGAAIIRRRLTGRSIYTTDRGHLHHAMAKKGLSPRKSLLWVGFLTSTTSMGAILALVNQQSEFAIISIGVVIIVLVVGRIFGAAEFELISRRAIGILRSFVKTDPANVHQSTVQLQGSRSWEAVWKQVCDFAIENSLNEITLDVNAPWLHENFHANRRLSGKKRSESQEWTAEIPLVSNGRICGKVSIWDSVNSQASHHEIVVMLLKVVADIELAITDTTEDASGVIIRPNEDRLLNGTLDPDSMSESGSFSP